MKNKLNVKLVGSYLLLSFIVVFSLALVINISFGVQFKQYVMNIQQEKNQKIVSSIITEYEKASQNIDYDTIDLIGMNALEEGLIVKIIDNNNNVLWDAMEHNSGMCVEMLSRMAENMKKIYPNFKGNHVEDEYLLEKNGVLYGKATIGYYGPYYYNENDIAFLQTFNNMLLIVVVLAIFLSLIFGILVARKITSNITKVVDVTKNIVDGNYNLKIVDDTKITEISDLISSINFLAQTLNKQTVLRKKLTVDIAHELRTPIAVLKSHLEALKDGVWEVDQKRIISLHDEVTRLSKLINGIDKLNDYDSNLSTLNKSKFDLRELIDHLVVNFDKELKDKNIKLQVIGNNITINADQDKITSVLVNLISNAIKYTDKAGNIKISIKGDKKNVVIEVSDDGIGIEKEHLPYIFERFYRVDNSRSRITGGTGIGLSIAKSIVENHKGSIMVRSKVNNGSTFIVTIPKK
jgi:signal transduction histidine kinase